MAATPTSEYASGAFAQRMPDELSPRHLVRRLLVLVVLVGVVAAAAASLPGLGTLRTRFSQADPSLLALIGVLKLGSCLSKRGRLS